MLRINLECEFEQISDRDDDDFIIVYRDSVFIVNNIAGEILKYIKNNKVKDVKQIISFLANEYNIDKKMIEEDIKECLETFMSKAIIIHEEA